jgi:alkylhydroperoxidase family enzyme
MARLPYVDARSAPGPVRETLEQLPVDLNIFRMMAHAETCFRPFLRLGTAILAEQKLDAKLRELAILRIGRVSDAAYEYGQHVPIAKAVGATDAQVEAIERGDIDASCFDDVERLVLRFTTELLRRAKPADATFIEMRRRFSPREIVELIMAIGFYMTIARLAETTEVDPDPPAGMTVVEASTRAR